MDRVTRAAPAKLNLRLLVGPRRADGYHDIRSLMVTLDGLADRVTLTRSTGREIHCPGVAAEVNLAGRALDVLEREVGHALPCTVSITKHIPMQAGLGGGSSNAAATLLGTNELFDLDLSLDRLEELAATIGSDVPFFIRGGCQWAEGRGEWLTPAVAPSFSALLAHPGAGLSTAAVFERFDALPPPPPADALPPPPTMPELAGWVRNDLWSAARDLEPRLDSLAADLRAAGAGAVLLCGSGSALAGLFTEVPPTDVHLRDPRAIVVAGLPAGGSRHG
jgi:4-diphosphocytidyl-2-C-methyl-D-erythritol kinase